VTQPIDPANDLPHDQFLQFQYEHTLLQQSHTTLQHEHANVLNQLSAALQAIANLSLEVQNLKDEIARLKNTPPRPKLSPGKLEDSGGGGGGANGKGKTGRGQHPRNNKKGLTFHNRVRLKPDNLPEGATYKDFHKYDVQDIICQAFNTRYHIERWELPDGTFVYGKLPSHVQGHYGAALRAHAILLSHSCRVSEELILEQLHRYRVEISAGQLSKMLTEGHENYHAEKDELLKAALESGEIQTDDVGTRHKAKNCYTNVICSEFFVYLSTTDSKSRINFLTILAQGRNEYIFNQDALDYLAVYKGAEKLIQAHTFREGLVINTEEPEKAFFNKLGHLNVNEIRLMTEAGLFASLIEHGVPRDLHIHSDDAGQFEIFKNSLCWIHEERHYRKIVPANPEIAAEIERVRDGIWQLYNDIKVYKEVPTELERARLFQAFDDLFNPKQPSPYKVINDRLALTHSKRDRLLLVLDRPTTPLHNNLSETGGRGAKVKSKISGGTRSDKGRRAWDTFGSLNLTCRRLGICFYDYLMDRFLGLNKIARLGTIISEKMQSKKLRSPSSGLAMALNTS
jgi:hypothetical protein